MPYDEYTQYEAIRDRCRDILKKRFLRGVYRRMSQEIDRHPSMVSDMLNGKGSPRPDILKEVAEWIREHEDDPSYAITAYDGAV